MIDLLQFHWVWYLVGWMFLRRTTIMIAICLYTNLPTWVKILFMCFAVGLDLLTILVVGLKRRLERLNKKLK